MTYCAISKSGPTTMKNANQKTRPLTISCSDKIAVKGKDAVASLADQTGAEAK